ncbi:unnamed protein product, partial [Iphiclides podalirius]
MRVIAVILLAAAAAADELCPTGQEANSEVGRLVVHSDCDKFYKCVNGEAIEMFCPDGLLFNSMFRFCDWSSNVDCGERSMPAEKVVTANIEDSPEQPNEEEVVEKTEIEFLENGCPVDPVVHWLVPDEQNCSSFYYCVWGEKVRNECPHSLHFNRNLQVCDWPQYAACTVSEAAVEITSTPSPVEES